MPTETEIKAFFINSGGEYKELGTITDIDVTKETEEPEKTNKIANTYIARGYTATFNYTTNNYTTKKYKRKRFKKLLMSKGIQRNQAEIYSRFSNRTQLALDLFF